MITIMSQIRENQKLERVRQSPPRKIARKIINNLKEIERILELRVGRSASAPFYNFSHCCHFLS